MSQNGQTRARTKSIRVVCVCVSKHKTTEPSPVIDRLQHNNLLKITDSLHSYGMNTHSHCTLKMFSGRAQNSILRTHFSRSHIARCALWESQSNIPWNFNIHLLQSTAQHCTAKQITSINCYRCCCYCFHLNSKTEIESNLSFAKKKNIQIQVSDSSKLFFIICILR